MFLRGPRGPQKVVNKGQQADQQAVYLTGGRGPPKLLVEAKSDENERRLRARDLTQLTRRGPMAQ